MFRSGNKLTLAGRRENNLANAFLGTVEDKRETIFRRLCEPGGGGTRRWKQDQASALIQVEDSNIPRFGRFQVRYFELEDVRRWLSLGSGRGGLGRSHGRGQRD